MTWLALCALVVLGAGWKWWDGRGGDGLTWLRSVLLGLMLGAAVWPLGWLGLWVAAVTAVSLTVGQTKWEDWLWQGLRYSSMAALAVLPIGLAAWPYVAACALGGLAYPLAFWMHERVVRLPVIKVRGAVLFDGPEAWARLFLGASVIGGLGLTGVP